MKYQDLARKLRAIGCEEISRRSGGSHRRWYNPITGKSCPVPDWGSKDLPPVTVRAIVRQLGLSKEDFGAIK